MHGSCRHSKRQGASAMTDVAAIGQKLLRASAQNDLEQLDSALRGASPDYANGIGQTGLHVASIHGHVEVVKRLLKAGALVSSTNRYGVTPLHYAADSGRIEVARLLIEAGANKRTRASNGKLPVDMIKEDADCAEELQALLGSGSNKLHRAIKGHNLALLRQLLEAGNDLSARSEEELVQCDTNKDQGCHGGLMDNAFAWVESNGIASESHHLASSLGKSSGRHISCTYGCCKSRVMLSHLRCARFHSTPNRLVSRRNTDTKNSLFRFHCGVRPLSGTR